MENNKSEFKATGIYFDGARVYEIQIARSGDAARYRMTAKYVVRDSEVTRGRWQEKRLCLHNHVRQENLPSQVSKSLLIWQTIGLIT